MGRTVVEDGGLDLDAYAAVTAAAGGPDGEVEQQRRDARGSDFNGNEDLDQE